MNIRPRVAMVGLYTQSNTATPEEMRENMAVGLRAGAALYRNGFAPLVPWLDWPLWVNHDLPTQALLEGYLSWVITAEAIFVVQPHKANQSENVQRELAAAQERGIPVFTTMQEIVEWRMASERQAGPATVGAGENTRP